MKKDNNEEEKSSICGNYRESWRLRATYGNICEDRLGVALIQHVDYVIIK